MLECVQIGAGLFVVHHVSDVVDTRTVLLVTLKSKVHHTCLLVDVLQHVPYRPARLLEQL